MKKENIIKLLEVEETIKCMQMSISPRARKSYLETYNRLYIDYMELKAEFTHDYNVRIDYNLKTEIIKQIELEEEASVELEHGEYKTPFLRDIIHLITGELINDMILRLQQPSFSDVLNY